MNPTSEDDAQKADPTRTIPPADFYSPRSSFISNASFCGYVEIDLNIYFKHISLTRICKNYIDKEFKGEQFLDIGINVHECKEFIQVPRALGDKRRFKLDCTTQYRFEADEVFLKTLSEKALIFKLVIINDKKELCLSVANLYVGDLLEVANKRVDGSIMFSSEEIDSNDNIACLELWYEFRCNKDEVVDFLTKVDKDQMKKITKFQPIDPEAGDFLIAKTSEIEISSTVKTESWLQHDANFQTVNFDAEVTKPELSITIAKLYFMDGSLPLKKDIEHVYVEYSFLGHSGPEMESPSSIPIGTLNRPSEFNWSQTFDLDVQTNYENCRLLLEILKYHDLVKFMVIGEPIECFTERVQMCEEVGYVEVLLEDIVKLHSNTDSYQYEIFDVHNPLSVIGYMTIEFKGIFALKNLVASFTAPKDYYNSKVFA